MRVKIINAISLDELKERMDQSFPQYQSTFRGKKVLVIQKDKKTGVIVMLGRKGIVRLNEGFPTLLGQFIFAICIVFLGVFIPFLIYFIAFRPAQRKLRNEIADFIKRNDGQVSGLFHRQNADLLDQR
jgi:hypothetical protein